MTSEEKKNAIKKFLEEVNMPKPQYLTTGLSTLDNYLGGGFVKNKIIGLSGNYSSGKTTLALQVASNLLNHNKNSACLYIDVEHSLSEKYVKNLHIDNNRFIYCEEDKIENILNLLNEALHNKVFDLIIIDSVTSIITKNLNFKEDFYNWINTFYTYLSENLLNTTLICIEQTQTIKINNLVLPTNKRLFSYYYYQYIGLFKDFNNEKHSLISIRALKNKNNNMNNTLSLNLDHFKGFV